MLFQTAGDGGELPHVQRKYPEGEPSETDGPTEIHLYWGGSIRSTLIWASASHAVHILEEVLDAVPHNLPCPLLPVLCVTGNKILMLLVVQWPYHIMNLKWWTDFTNLFFIGFFMKICSDEWKRDLNLSLSLSPSTGFIRVTRCILCCFVQVVSVMLSLIFCSSYQQFVFCFRGYQRFAEHCPQKGYYCYLIRQYKPIWLTILWDKVFIMFGWSFVAEPQNLINLIPRACRLSCQTDLLIYSQICAIKHIHPHTQQVMGR